jgi:hypothetical protein
MTRLYLGDMCYMLGPEKESFHLIGCTENWGHGKTATRAGEGGVEDRRQRQGVRARNEGVGLRNEGVGVRSERWER